MADFSIQDGLNVANGAFRANGTVMHVGNSTSNVVANTTSVRVGNTSNYFATLFPGRIETQDPSGNTSVEAPGVTSANSTLSTALTPAGVAASQGANSATLTVSSLTIANSTLTSQYTHAGLGVGANVDLTSVALLIGNSTVNTVVTSSAVTSPAIRSGLTTTNTVVTPTTFTQTGTNGVVTLTDGGISANGSTGKVSIDPGPAIRFREASGVGGDLIMHAETLNDEEEIDLTSVIGTVGVCILEVVDSAGGFAYYTLNGGLNTTSEMMDRTATFLNANTDGSSCIFHASSAYRLKNRTGGARGYKLWIRNGI